MHAQGDIDMTTNVYDDTQNMLACDSRWTYKSAKGDITMYIDDAQFEKLEVINGIACMFAGEAEGILQWKNHLRDPHNVPEPDLEKENPADHVSIFLVEDKSGRVIFHYGHESRARLDQNGVLHYATFAGTGAVHATIIWQMSGCPLQATKHAIRSDSSCGGVVRQYNPVTGKGNLVECKGLDSVLAKLKERGIVMMSTEQSTGASDLVAMGVAEAASINPDVQQALDDLEAGRAGFSAPCDAMTKRMPTEKRLELRSVVNKYFK